MIQCCSEAIERQGIHAVGLAVSKLGGIFREQSTSDYGIDAMFEARSGFELERAAWPAHRLF